MRVLFVAQSASLTGASHSMVDLIRGVLDRGHEALVLLPESGPLEELLQKHGIQFVKGKSRPWIGATSPFRYYRRWWQIRRGAKAAVRMLSNQPFDLVYTNTITSPFGALIALGLGLPNVWQIRENLPTAEEAGPPGALEKAQAFFNEFSTLCVGNSKHIFSEIVSWVGEGKARLVYSGPFDDEEPSRPLVRRADSAGPFRLLLVGRMNPLKRPEDAVQALSILVKRGSDARLTMLGKSYGGYDDQLRALARESGVLDRIEMPGYLDDTRRIYEESHVNLNCADAEPFGRTILEGMAFGCPTVAADGGGTPEVIEHGVTGLMYPPGDVNALADEIEKVLKSPALAEELSQGGRNRILPYFTRGRYVSDMLNVFEEAIQLSKSKT